MAGRVLPVPLRCPHPLLQFNRFPIGSRSDGRWCWCEWITSRTETESETTDDCVVDDSVLVPERLPTRAHTPFEKRFV